VYARSAPVSKLKKASALGPCCPLGRSFRAAAAFGMGCAQMCLLGMGKAGGG
jgi:hypothetical protein